MICRETRYKAVVHYKHFLRSIRAVASIYKVSKSSLQRWIRADPTIKRRRKPAEVRKDVSGSIERLLLSNPFSTMRDIAATLETDCGIRRSPRTVNRYVHSRGWTRKSASARSIELPPPRAHHHVLQRLQVVRR